VDFQIPARKVGDDMLDRVADWRSYRLEKQNQVYSSAMRRRASGDRKALAAVFGEKGKFNGSAPAELFALLRRFVRSCDDLGIWEGKAMYLLVNCLPGAAATRFAKVLPDSAGYIPGRTGASFPEAVNWLLVNYADAVLLNQAVADVNRAALGPHEQPDTFAERIRSLGESCGNVFGEDRLKMTYTQGLPKHLQVDFQQYNLQFPENTLQQLASFTRGKYEQVRALQSLEPVPPTMYAVRPTGNPTVPGPRGVLKAPVLAVGESSSQSGGRVEGWRGFVHPNTPTVVKAGDRPPRIRTCWLCHKEDHIAVRCPEVPKDLQEKLAKQGIQFAKAVRWVDRQGRTGSSPLRSARTVHNLRVGILQSIQEQLYKDYPADFDSGPEKTDSLPETPPSGNE